MVIWLEELVSLYHKEKSVNEFHICSLSILTPTGIYTGIAPRSPEINTEGQFRFVFQNHYFI
jgi:hypothetical protein